ncbi:MAG: hypothetical protein ABMA13_23030 [Chthoniobacteraceae bacterium]
MSGRAAFTITRGVCWGCGCTKFAACMDEEIGEPCGWANEAEAFCTVCAIGYGDAMVAAAMRLRAQPERLVAA